MSASANLPTVDYGDVWTNLSSTVSGSFSGEILRHSNTTTTKGDLYYLSSSGTWQHTNAAVNGSETYCSSSLLGIAVGTNSTTHGMLVKGIATINPTGSEVIGQRVFIAENEGGFTTTAPSTTGDIVRVVGYTVASGRIYFDPDKTWVEIA